MKSNKDNLKAEKERRVVRNLAAARGWPIDVQFIQSGNVETKEPDVIYTGNNKKIAFEVTEIRDQEGSNAGGIAIKSGEATAFMREKNVATRILQSKLEKNYAADCPIELVCFWNAGTFEKDAEIVGQVAALMPSLKAKFIRVWYLGAEDVFEFCGDNSPIIHGLYPPGVKKITIPIPIDESLDGKSKKEFFNFLERIRN